jgi:hypothetical protein
MNSFATLALYMTLAAMPALSAHAQPAANPQGQPQQTQRAIEPVYCTYLDSGSRALQPCRVRPAAEATHMGQDVTRQEIECLLSGECSVVAGGRVNA